jgi:tRNA(fMet)-specific endonuclease VapC
VSKPSYLLDTNSCIFLLARARPALTDRVEDCAPGTIAISAIVCAELALGFGRGYVKGRAALKRFLGQFPVMPFDEKAARAYARVPFKRGKLDRLIAAHALALDIVLITNNQRDFADVEGLKTEDWTQP